MRFLYILFIAGMLGCVGPSAGQSSQPDRIGFVRMMVTENSVTLLETTVRPGRLKAERSQAKGELAFDVLASDERVMWTGTLDDPLVVRQEYVDEDGQLRVRVIEQEEAEVIIRIPVSEARHTIRLFRTSGVGKSSDRQLIGSVEAAF